jgi:hypothetical protein
MREIEDYCSFEIKSAQSASKEWSPAVAEEPSPKELRKPGPIYPEAVSQVCVEKIEGLEFVNWQFPTAPPHNVKRQFGAPPQKSSTSKYVYKTGLKVGRHRE